jgi:hypothetical protein
MQQHDSNILIYEKEQRFNILGREEVVPRYRFISPPYYRKDHDNEKFEQRVHNFEPSIQYVVE